ncbi:hypothetical protein EK21DRAFT_93029 [Setomelanomma holmii]|uniref:RING-type domain-containing protein n=1 Tax=Setomelanomma holmii TaxID=210430 RepID=A0A9P4LJ39_9PLEO|nr:hypothetical protein EK21DRAFT_93029 [Setomelanomma holmii]
MEFNAVDIDLDAYFGGFDEIFAAAFPPEARPAAPARPAPPPVPGPPAAVPPTPTQPKSVAAASESTRTTAFFVAHTTPDTQNSLIEECPICLDNYTSEQCLRITGIPGCTHRIGKTCLEEMLRNRASDEKKCPLCRTLWIAGSTYVPGMRIRGARTARIVPNSNGGIGLARRDSHYVTTGTAGPGRLRPLPEENANNIATPFARQTAARMEAKPSQLINLDSDEEEQNYNAQLENFNNLTRDIQNVRARAHETQIPRSQRRREMREAAARQCASIRPGERDYNLGIHRPGPGSAVVGFDPGAPGTVRGASNAPIRLNRLLNPFANSFRPSGTAPTRHLQRSATVGHRSRVNSPRLGEAPRSLLRGMTAQVPATTPNSSTSTTAASPGLGDAPRIHRPGVTVGPATTPSSNTSTIAAPHRLGDAPRLHIPGITIQDPVPTPTPSTSTITVLPFNDRVPRLHVPGLTNNDPIPTPNSSTSNIAASPDPNETSRKYIPSLTISHPSPPPNSSPSTIAAISPRPDPADNCRCQTSDARTAASELRETGFRQRESDLDAREARILVREATIREREEQVLGKGAKSTPDPCKDAGSLG